MDKLARKFIKPQSVYCFKYNLISKKQLFIALLEKNPNKI